jgi:hypothetical protein
MNTFNSQFLTASATPAIDLQDLMLDGKLSRSERDEARGYFASRGGLNAVSTAERDFCVTNDICDYMDISKSLRAGHTVIKI